MHTAANSFRFLGSNPHHNSRSMLKHAPGQSIAIGLRAHGKLPNATMVILTSLLQWNEKPKVERVLLAVRKGVDGNHFCLAVMCHFLQHAANSIAWPNFTNSRISCYLSASVCIFCSRGPKQLKICHNSRGLGSWISSCRTSAEDLYSSAFLRSAMSRHFATKLAVHHIAHEWGMMIFRRKCI